MNTSPAGVDWNEWSVQPFPAPSSRTGWIVSFARYLRALDDLWRKITQDSLAVALGAGWVAGFAYIAADAAGLIARDLDIALFPVLLGAVYIVAVAVGWIRYR